MKPSIIALYEDGKPEGTGAKLTRNIAAKMSELSAEDTFEENISVSESDFTGEGIADNSIVIVSGAHGLKAFDEVKAEHPSLRFVICNHTVPAELVSNPTIPELVVLPKQFFLGDEDSAGRLEALSEKDGVTVISVNGEYHDFLENACSDRVSTSILGSLDIALRPEVVKEEEAEGLNASLRELTDEESEGSLSEQEEDEEDFTAKEAPSRWFSREAWSNSLSGYQKSIGQFCSEHKRPLQYTALALVTFGGLFAASKTSTGRGVVNSVRETVGSTLGLNSGPSQSK